MIPLRKPCSCGSPSGIIVEKGGQDTVRCIACDSFCYCAPKTETGKAELTTKRARKSIHAGKRARIIERDGNQCIWCHASDVPLQIGHIISLEAGVAYGLTEHELYDDENLVAICGECNLGMGSAPMPLPTAVKVLRVRRHWRDRQ